MRVFIHICITFISITFISITSYADTVHVGVRFSFETAYSTVYGVDYKKIKELVELKKKFPDADILISGHTDSIASDLINQPLSEARANSIKDLILKFDNSAVPSKIETKGFGKTAPIADNTTAEGRERNRRFTVSFYDLANEDAVRMIDLINNSKYLFLISHESNLVEEHIGQISEDNSQVQTYEKSIPEDIIDIEEHVEAVESIETSISNSIASKKQEGLSLSYWKGCYVGLNGGYSLANADVKNVTQSDLGSQASKFNQKFDLEGNLFGLSIGCSYLLKDRIVWGFDFDHMLTKIDGNYGPTNSRIDASVDRVSVVRARIGYPVNKYYFYGSAGIAIAKLDVVVNEFSESFVGSDQKNLIGFLMGFGLDYALAEKFIFQAIIGMGYFPKEDYTFADEGPNGYANAYANGGATVYFLRLGLNYKL